MSKYKSDNVTPEHKTLWCLPIAFRMKSNLDILAWPTGLVQPGSILFSETTACRSLPGSLGSSHTKLLPAPEPLPWWSAPYLAWKALLHIVLLFSQAHPTSLGPFPVILSKVASLHSQRPVFFYLTPRFLYSTS